MNHSLINELSDDSTNWTIMEHRNQVIFCNTPDLLEFNFSQYDYPGSDGPWPPPLDFISGIKITCCIVNMVMSILGNCAVIMAVYHNPALRSTINFYLVNLAIADVLIALCCMWPNLVNDLTKPAFILGDFMCKFNGFAQSKFLSSINTKKYVNCSTIQHRLSLFHYFIISMEKYWLYVNDYDREIFWRRISHIIS